MKPLFSASTFKPIYRCFGVEWGVADKNDELRKLLDGIVNRSEPYTAERALVAAVRKALSVFADAPYFAEWRDALIAELETPKAVPFVIDTAKLPKGSKLEPLDHVGPRSSEAPTIRRWTDEEGKPLVLNPTEDFGGDDSESHYAAPAAWAEIRKAQEERGE